MFRPNCIAVLDEGFPCSLMASKTFSQVCHVSHRLVYNLASKYEKGLCTGWSVCLSRQYPGGHTILKQRRWIDVLSTLCARWDVSCGMYIFISLFLYVYTFHYRNSLCNAYTPCYSIIYCENMACRGGVVFQDPFYTTFHLCFILFTCSNISLHKHHLIRFTNKRFSMSHVRKKEKKKVLFFSGILLDLC